MSLPGVAEDVLVAAALEHGVRVEGIGTYRIVARLAGPDTLATLLLGYGRLAEPAIPAAVASLAEAARSARQGRAVAPASTH
jgi:DNA-binding transcriptional MocR family regulator